MPIGLLGALLGSALIGGGTALAGALSRPRSSRAAERAATEGLQYQNLLLQEYGLPVLREHTIPALRRRSELERALWPLIEGQLRGALAPTPSPGSVSPDTQRLYRAIRGKWMQEQEEAKKRIAMDLAARGGIRSGAYPKRLENLERDTRSGLAALYAELVREDVEDIKRNLRRRRDLAMDLASRILGAGPSPLTAGDVSGLASSLSSQAMRLGQLGQARQSALAQALSQIFKRLPIPVPKPRPYPRDPFTLF